MKRSNTLETARRHFVNAYLNTGCEVDEAEEALRNIEVDFTNKCAVACHRTESHSIFIRKPIVTRICERWPSPMNPQSYLYGRGYRRLNVNPLAEALRLSTLEEQRKALAEAAARRTNGPADRSRDQASPATHTDYPPVSAGGQHGGRQNDTARSTTSLS